MKKRVLLNLSRDDAAILCIALYDYYDEAFPENMARLDDIHRRIMDQLHPERKAARKAQTLANLTTEEVTSETV